MLTDYAYIGLFFLAAFAVAAGMVLLPVLLRLIGLAPKKPNAVKNSTFECGMETIGKTQVRFNFRYYFYALVFLALEKRRGRSCRNCPTVSLQFIGIFCFLRNASG